jgi:DNA-binding response OmpR family regulator
MTEADRPARILIADDHPQGVELLDAYLAETGFDVESAHDGEETMRKVRDWRPDVVLLDIMMPKISGFEVCKRLKSDAATRGVAVLMITALDQPSDVERAVEAGTDDFLTKPVNQTDLLRRIRALLASRQQAGELERTLAYMDAVERGGS